MCGGYEMNFTRQMLQKHNKRYEIILYKCEMCGCSLDDVSRKSHLARFCYDCRIKRKKQQDKERYQRLQVTKIK